jgi:uncharacterized circularly permuted ATP-grasp superfamily protein/uncharacterized alpha-E superfamily protein
MIAARYAPIPGTFDEMTDPEGRVRPGWKKLVERLDALGEAELARRWEKASQLIHENGVSYNVYGDPQGMERPWRLSPLPMVLSAQDWSLVERGVDQRARVLAALLADLHGPQRTLQAGVLPPELVFGGPGFLRAVHGLAVPRDDFLPLYGADLVRAPDGQFRLLEDRTQAPTGAGYALENRVVVSSALPDLLRECNVERLAPFFRALRETLEQLAPHNRDNPRIVLLTPGPYDATYFEQAYFAQYLGFTLVNGADLTVRDERVFLKTLGGLQPVDVIFRRVNDELCDPLELRPESMLGVPGLVQAVRAGNVAIANPLGSGLVQTAAVLPYVPALCKHLLSEELLLPSVRTWWCGDPTGLAEATARFSALVLRTTWFDGTPPVLTTTLTAAERDELLARVKARPSAWVAQEHLPFSTTPLLEDGSIAPRPLVLRCYAVSTRSRDYLVMPGGLARVASSELGAVVSMREGARSKDVWVLSNDPVSAFSLVQPAARTVGLSRGGSELPSRAADNLYWLGRYAERAEGVARLTRVIAARLGELGGQPELDRSTEFGAMLAALKAQTEFLYFTDIPVEPAPRLEAAEAQLVAAVCDPQSMGSLAQVVKLALRSGRLVRDRISIDTWRVLSTLDEAVSALELPAGSDRASALTGLLSRVVVTLAGFSGLTMESMTRGQGWHFLDMGRRIERAITLTTLLRATTTRTFDRERPLLEAVLEIADSGMTYRRRYLATLQAAPVVDLLLGDDSNPRSVLYQVRALAEHVRGLPPLEGAGVRSPQLRMVLTAQNELELADLEQLCHPDESGARPALEALLRRLNTVLPALSESLSDTYLNHASASRHLGSEGT